MLLSAALLTQEVKLSEIQNLAQRLQLPAKFKQLKARSLIMSSRKSMAHLYGNGPTEFNSPGFNSNLGQTQDSKIPVKDNIFTAFDGAKGTGLDNDNSFNKPMNMTLTFP